MPVDQNVAIVRRYYEECANDRSPNKQQALELTHELLTTDFAMRYNHTPAGDAPQGRDHHKEFLVGHARAFPGEHWTIEALVADEETVACQWRVQATHAETGNPMDLRGADFFTVRNGQLAELHRLLDFQTLQEQMQPRQADQETPT